MKHLPYHTKRFWKLVEKEYLTRKTCSDNLYEFLCHGSPTFKEQWQSADFRMFCRLHSQGLPDCRGIDDDYFSDAATLFVTYGREVRLRFLAHMVAISLRSAKNQ